MRQADRFLFSLVLNAGRRGRRFVLKQEYANELVDKWLCLMADIDAKRLGLGPFSNEELQIKEVAQWFERRGWFGELQ